MAIAMIIFSNFPVWPLLVIIVLWFILTALGSFNIQWNYFLPALHYNAKVTEKCIAVTFDDGPNPKITPKVLNVLDKFNARASFFCIGKQIKKYPDLAKKIITSGHTIGQHSFSHANSFGFFSINKVLDEINDTNQLTVRLLNKKLKLFRPPFGVTNPAIAKATKLSGLTVIGWNRRSYDTVTKSTEKIFKRITHNLQAGDIILLHDTNARCPKVLEQLLQFLYKNDFKLVTVDQLLKIEPYE